MKTAQFYLASPNDLAQQLPALIQSAPDLVLVFGAVNFFEHPEFTRELAAGLASEALPNTVLVGCSTAGEIAGSQVYDDSCVLTSVQFANTPITAVTTEISGMADSFAAGQRLGRQLPQDQLSAVLLLGTGVAINGSALVAGLQQSLPAGVTISGGLAADAGAFRQTWTLGPAGSSDRQLVALGFYGSQIQCSYGTFAGWETFGPARKVTRSDGNILYELDGNRALDVYKLYLGDYAKDLPGSGLLFPFAMLNDRHEKRSVFRTILGVDDSTGSLTLAGDIDPDGYLKLMHSSTDNLISGAETAAKTARQNHRHAPAESLAILVSCVGRKLVMGDRIDEEAEAVVDVLGQGAQVAGFYSNGEIAQGEFQGDCRLHNQTMTITWLSELQP